ncbi:hypothetical protein OOJ91_14185 [Micromonospora lupini]|uniref:hypothetical protein n=1 Tax=Micromonospora lupini TaxID=285679 RepID=UPI0022586EE0|nr:hypothetical protein [Micromonospora lupini]MCX5066996.1 hypothetical protein [Micromonospora lupini]
MTPPQVARAAGCKAETCKGRWADDAGCLADKVIVGDQRIYIESPVDNSKLMDGTNTVFYSPACQATWADWHITFDETDWEPEFQFWGLSQYGANEMRKPEAESDLFPGSYVNYTSADVDLWRSAMTDWNTSVKSCWYIAGGSEEPPTPTNDPDEELSCTDWI